jgi:hypothetical protein
MTRVVRDAEYQLNDGGDTAAAPDLSPKAIRFGTTVQQLGQTRQLFGRQAAGRAAVGTRPQGLWSPVAGACHPLADGTPADAYRIGDLTLGPALLLEAPGLESSGFLPICEVTDSCIAVYHSTAKTLAFNVRISNTITNLAHV